MSENYLTRKIIARNILDMKYLQFTVHVVETVPTPVKLNCSISSTWEAELHVLVYDLLDPYNFINC